MSRPRLTAAIAALALASGCAAPAPGVVGPTATPKAPRDKTPAPVPTPSAPPTGLAPTVPPVVTLPGPNLISDQGGAIISDQGASLTGLVRAPAQVVSTGGGGILGNNGAGVVSTGGGGYRLAAVPDQPLLAGATVKVVDAAGAPVLGPDGKPLTAVTGANGRYRFDVPIPGQNVVVQVDLGEKGALLAIAAPNATQRVADLDLVSSLTTTYILDRYVRPQPQQVAVLDKLPADVEAVTRARARDALAGGDVAGLSALTPVAVVATVDALRAKDAAFDAQLEVVKKLLVAAGQSDLGAGRPGTEVALGPVETLQATPEGLLIATNGRLWRLGPDGLLRTVAGSGSRGEIDGKPAAEAGLVSLEGLARDAQGRLLLYEQAYDDAACRVSRLGADGTVQELYKQHWDLVMPSAVIGEAEGEIRVLAGNAVYGITGKAQLTKRYDLPADFPAGPATRIATAVDAQGRLYVARAINADAVVGRYDPVAKTATTVAKAGVGGVTSLALDARGHVAVRDAAGAVALIAPDGTRKPLATSWPEPLRVAGFGLDPAGGGWLAGAQHVYRLGADGTRTLVAGTPATEPKPGQAADFAFEVVSGLAPLPGRELVASDWSQNRLVAFQPKGALRVIAGDGTKGAWVEGAQALGAPLNGPSLVRTDAQGDVYFVTEGQIRKLDRAAGTVSTVATPADPLDDMVVAPDGAIWWSMRHYTPGTATTDGHYDAGRLVRRAPDGTLRTAFEQTTRVDAFWLAVAPDGAVHALKWQSDGYCIWRCAATGEPTQVTGAAKLRCERAGRFAIDAKGRYYTSTDFQRSYSEKIQRWDPATGAEALIAGPGGRAFTGEGVDDGIKTAGWLAFDAAGTLFFGDVGHKQVKGIPAATLDLPDN